MPLLLVGSGVFATDGPATCPDAEGRGSGLLAVAADDARGGEVEAGADGVAVL
ncbi:MAG: hypothetical protein ABL909_04200 [Sphingopyxis sp.]